MRRSLLIFVLVAASAIARGATVDVHIASFTYNPQFVTINVGDSVRWINDDFAVHTATSGTSFTPDGKFNTGNLAHNATKTILFSTPGVYFYYCAVHTSGMTAGNNYSVTVLAPPTLTGTLTLDSLAGNPAGLTSTVEFRNPGTTTVAHSYPITLAADGSYNAGTVHAGTWDVAVKVTNWLRSKTSSTVIAAGANTVDLFLINGDSFQDNAVDLFDLNNILGNFATPDPGGDIDLSGSVDLFDLNTALTNFGTVGAS